MADGLLSISVPEGSVVKIGQVIGYIDVSMAAATATAKPTPVAAGSAGGPSTSTLAAASAVASTATPAPVSAPPVVAPGGVPASGSEPILSPAARRIVAERGLDPADIPGTGRGGRITKEDAANFMPAVATPSASASMAPSVPASLPNAANGPTAPLPATGKPGSGAGSAAPAAPTPSVRETRQRMTSIRARIAERLVQSQQTTATLTTFNEADMSAIQELRAKYKDKFKEKHGVNLGFMSFFVKAAISALKTYPIVNARIDGQDVVHQHFYDIGVAVSTERGLMVPILRDADQMSFADIEKKIGEMASKAREGKISVSDLQGGTFTITNGGIFGSLLSTPILNPPQTAILGMHAIQKRPVVVNDQIVIRPMMYLALSYDHRLIDGKDAVLFLVKIKECVENPERLLLEI